MASARPPSVYLDHAASTSMRPAAREALLAGLELGPANASGSHRMARRARTAVDDARESLADVIGVDAGDIVFTSGGTEGDNLAVLGVGGAGDAGAAGHSVLCSAVEHPAVLEPVLMVGGSTCAVDDRGVVSVDDLRALLASRSPDHSPSLVSIMTVNNEVGVVQPIDTLAAAVREVAPGALIHTDAVQALSWIDLRQISPLVDILTLSAHKFGGPHGVGACVFRNGAAVSARQLGGGQERERRSGTLNVAGIMSMAAAAVETDTQRLAELDRIGHLRDRLVDEVVRGVTHAIQTGVSAGDTSHLAPGFAHFCFADIESEALLFLLDDAGIAASAASACASGAQHPSHVLEAMGVDRRLAGGSLRLSLGHTTTEDDIDRAGAAVVAAVNRLRTYPR